MALMWANLVEASVQALVSIESSNQRSENPLLNMHDKVNWGAKLSLLFPPALEIWIGLLALDPKNTRGPASIPRCLQDN